MVKGHPEKLSSPAAAVLIRDQLQDKFQRLEAVELPVRVNNRQIIHGNGGLSRHPENPDSIARFEFRQNPKNKKVTYVEFQDQLDPLNVRFVRFRLPGGDTPMVNLDMWSVPGRAEVNHNLSAREASSGRHQGSVALGNFVYGREHDLALPQSLRVRSLLASLEVGVKYHIGLLEEEKELQKARA